MTCNTELIFIEKNEIKDKIDQEILNIFNEFYYCKVCDKVYWKGSHFKHMESLIVSIAEK